MFEACSCEDPECGKVVRNYFDIPPENLKLSPLTVDDLVKASRQVSPSATPEDVEQLNYFHKHRKLPSNKDALSAPGYRSQSISCAGWLIGIAVVMLSIFVLLLFCQISCNCLHKIL